MVGDVVLGVPALKLLDAHGYDLYLYGKGWAPKLLEGHGWPCTVRAGSLKERIAQLRELKSRCLAQDPGFDQRVNTLAMPNSFSSVFEPWRAGLRVAGFPRDAGAQRKTQWQAARTGRFLAACLFFSCS